MKISQQINYLPFPENKLLTFIIVIKRTSEETKLKNVLVKIILYYI